MPSTLGAPITDEITFVTSTDHTEQDSGLRTVESTLFGQITVDESGHISLETADAIAQIISASTELKDQHAVTLLPAELRNSTNIQMVSAARVNGGSISGNHYNASGTMANAT